MLDVAKCPECGWDFDPVQAHETDCHNMTPLHCAWCADRQQLVRAFEAWLVQDQALRADHVQRRSQRMAEERARRLRQGSLEV